MRKARSLAEKPRQVRKSVVTLVVTHTFKTKKALRESVEVIDATFGGADGRIIKFTVRDVDFD